MEYINGFKVIRVTKKYYCMAICKHCNKQWETNIYTLKSKVSCGCISWHQLKPLPKCINGFKTIKCLGYNQERGVRRAIVQCKECKKEYEVDPNKLQYRKHCGCLKMGVVACRYAKSHPQLSQAYKHMISRCYNVNDQDYYNYGARGIRVCAQWKKDRNIFCEWAIENGFKNNEKLSLDRIDGKKGYNPSNCKWSTATEQARNTRRNVLTMDLANKLRKDAKNMKYS